jgi:hypothetical protein
VHEESNTGARLRGESRPHTLTFALRIGVLVASSNVARSTEQQITSRSQLGQQSTSDGECCFRCFPLRPRVHPSDPATKSEMAKSALRCHYSAACGGDRCSGGLWAAYGRIPAPLRPATCECACLCACTCTFLQMALNTRAASGAGNEHRGTEFEGDKPRRRIRLASLTQVLPPLRQALFFGAATRNAAHAEFSSAFSRNAPRHK